jgi:hypothetical protein
MAERQGQCRMVTQPLQMVPRCPAWGVRHAGTGLACRLRMYHATTQGQSQTTTQHAQAIHKQSKKSNPSLSRRHPSDSPNPRIHGHPEPHSRKSHRRLTRRTSFVFMPSGQMALTMLHNNKYQIFVIFIVNLIILINMVIWLI